MYTHKSPTISAVVASGGLCAILLLWLHIYGPVWPYRDSFAYLHFLDEIRAGNLGLFEFLTLRNNEHFVAFHYAVALLILAATGLSTKALVFANAALLVVASLFVYATVQSSVVSRRAAIVLPFVAALTFINPSQASYLIWEFQIWLYIDLALLAVICFVVERHGTRSYPVVALLCLLGTGSEAQGAFLWLAAGLHLFCVARRGERRSQVVLGALMLSLNAVVFAVVARLLMQAKIETVRAAQGESLGLLSDAAKLLEYFVTIVGGVFGNRNHSFAFWAGAVLLLSWVGCTLWGARRKFSTPVLRTALVLTTTSLFWIAAFSVGRHELGIAWAFGHFHSSPMLLPFVAGLGLYGAAIVDARQSAWGWLVVAVAVVPTFVAIPFGYARSVEIRQNSLIAASAECGSAAVPAYLRLHANGIEGHPQLYDEIREHRADLCSSAGGAHLDELALMPSSWAKLGSGGTKNLEALSVLWAVYLSHGDLRAAFPISSPGYMPGLLQWAAHSGRTGNDERSKTLAPYVDAYSSLIGAS